MSRQRDQDDEFPLIDALPCIDSAIDENEDQRNLALQEVDDEMYIFPPDKDYLEYLPLDLKSRTFSTPLIEHEHQIIENQIERTSKTALSTIRIDDPPTIPSNPDDLNESQLQQWADCLKQLKINIEYRNRQLMNLEISKTYNEPASERFTVYLEDLKLSFQQELVDLTKKIEQINLSRSKSQESIAKMLNVLQAEWNSLVDRNRMLSQEITSITNSQIKKSH